MEGIEWGGGGGWRGVAVKVRGGGKDGWGKGKEKD